MASLRADRDCEEGQSLMENQCDPPPSYEEGSDTPSTASQPATLRPTPLPNYQVATKLPTYEESERLKEQELNGTGPDDGLPSSEGSTPVHSAHHLREHHAHAGFALLTFPGWSEADLDGGNDLTDIKLLGTDFVFFTSFIISFLFNWVGFLLLMCFCHTIAARYGALSGFGLSLTKWTLIFKRSTEMSSAENAWIWWLIMAFGLMICVRAIVQYLHIKRTWRSLSTAARERLFFFF